MNENLETTNVEAVLLRDGWHSIVGASFHIRPYEFTTGPSLDGITPMALVAGESPAVPTLAAGWLEGKDRRFARLVVCPLTALVAVELKAQMESGHDRELGLIELDFAGLEALEPEPVGELEVATV
jgi:hypothetical protein